MKVVVIGGHARKVGKTSVVEGLLRGLKSLRWTAVKISQHTHEVSAPAPRGRTKSAARPGFTLLEERNPQGRGDTSRYLSAGAARALWLRVRRGHLASALPALRRALRNDRHVIIESNQILRFLEPKVFLMVLDRRTFDFKRSARAVLRRADAWVTVDSPPLGQVWPDLDPLAFEGKKSFPVSRQDYFSPELCRFVRQRLAQPNAPAWRASRPHDRKEPTWRHSAKPKSKPS